MNDTDTDAAESVSLADHEQTYVSHEAPAPVPDAQPTPAPEPESGPEPERPDQSRDGERDEHGRFVPKQRAKSQNATPADVPLIAEYTKRLREAEDALGVKIEKKEGESERVFQLRRRAELAEKARDAVKNPPRVEPRPQPRQPEAPKEFTEKEPQYDDFADQPDQYAAHLRAVAAYDRRKEAFEQQQQYAKTEHQRGIEERNKQRDAWFKEQEQQHYGRMQAYHQAHPEAQAILDAAGDVWLTPAMYAAVMTHENSPELLLRVAQDQDLRDDLVILTEGKPLNRDLVALVQRRLNRGRTDGQTGSSPAPQKPVAAVPRPPNPVRTGPMKPADAPPGDDAPLSEHERAYGGKRRR